MTAYRGGENIYQNRDDSTELEMFFMTTTDGWNWTGVDPDRMTVLRGGISETGFEFDKSGDLYAVSRNEAGDSTGFGSRLCSAKAGAYGDWQCQDRSDPNKYDSPFMLRYQEELYLVARYNPGGPYDRAPDEPVTQRRFWSNEVHYSTSSKRTALYGYDRQNMKIRLLSLLPSSGDTAFAGGVWLDEHRMALFNYSSDPEQPDMWWIEGQIRGSQIYMSVLDFEDGKAYSGTAMNP